MSNDATLRKGWAGAGRGKRAAHALLLFVTLCLSAPVRAVQTDPVDAVTARYMREVDMRLSLPANEQRAYAGRLQAALGAAGIREFDPQFFLLIDRSPVVQAAFIYWLAATGEWRFIGASPVSTGYAGGFEYFITPLGVFEHTLANLDFRAEGTLNKLGIRGYGARGMRIYDFGWVEAERTWDKRGRSPMRLQVHATDPDVLEHQLGQPRSKGCIRIPATLNLLIDRLGLLDAEYDQALREGRQFWVLRSDRQPVAAPGKYLVVVDSARNRRPAWSPSPPWPRKRGNHAADHTRDGDPAAC